jgi:hypothetical protein
MKRLIALDRTIALRLVIRFFLGTVEVERTPCDED